MKEPVSVLFWTQRVNWTSPTPLFLPSHLPVKSGFSTIKDPDELDVDTIPPELLLELDDKPPEEEEEDELDVDTIPPELLLELDDEPPEEEDELEIWSGVNPPDDDELLMEPLEEVVLETPPVHPGTFEHIEGFDAQQPNMQQLLSQSW